MLEVIIVLDCLLFVSALCIIAAIDTLSKDMGR